MNAHAQSISYEQSTKLKYAEIAKRLGKVPAKTAILIPMRRERTPANALPMPIRYVSLDEARKTPHVDKPYDHHTLLYYSRLSATGYLQFRAFESGFTVAELKTIQRNRKAVMVRGEIAYVMKTKFDLSYPTIGRLFNRDHSTILSCVRGHCKRHGLAVPPTNPMSIPQDIINIARQRLKDGGQLSMICESLGVSVSGVRKAGISQGWYVPSPHAQKNAAHAKINEAEAYKLFCEGASCRFLAKKYYVAYRTMCRYITGKGWIRA